MAQVPTDETTVLRLTPAERAERGLDADDVSEALVRVLRHGSAEQKEIVDCTFPAISLANLAVEPDETHPVTFRNCTFEGLDLTGAHLRIPVLFEDCTVGDIDAEGAWLEDDFELVNSTVTGEIDCFETKFQQDARFAGTTFEQPVAFDETTFGDDTRFDGATFTDIAQFRAASFNGISNQFDDNVSFEGTRFEADADFTQASFEHSVFTGTVVEGAAHFREATFDGDVAASGLTFKSAANFEEIDVRGDLDMEGTAFEASVAFDGCKLRGGARSLEDDMRLVDVSFEGPVSFESGRVRGFNATGATFEAEACFDEFHADGDVQFEDVSFQGPTRFYEALFEDDAAFSGARFHDTAVFRGARFLGAKEAVDANARFDEVRFDASADFTNAGFTTASFAGTEFAATVEFTDATFDGQSEFRFEPTTAETYVDFTAAIIKEGTITQPDSAWVSYDFTDASLGSVTLTAAAKADRKQLLDYFRFCNTEFNEFDGYEFDFSAHTDYLDRNGWVLHDFQDQRTDPSYATAMTPSTIETTYLKAKTAASAAGQMKPAGEFRVKRQQYARQKYVDIARDGSTEFGTRLLNAGRAAENAFLGVTCGHGMRLVRIISVFLLFPLLPALLYTFGGPMFATTNPESQLASLGALTTASGQAILYENIHFSYITFLTIGYGNIGPSGALARMLAGLEVYVSVILSGLVLYGLIKRSEI